MEQIQTYLTTGNLTWVTFILSAALIVVAAMQLAKYGDVIAARTGAGGMFIGVLLMAGATSLPEFLTGINAIIAKEPNIAAGNLFGSSAFNMFILAILDIFSRDQRILRASTFKHVLSGSMAVFLTTIVLFFIAVNPVLERIHFQVFWLGIDSIIIMAFYVFGIYMIQKNDTDAVSAEMSEEELKSVPSLRVGFLGFGLAALVLILVTPFMVRSSATIADMTGLGTSFVGSTLVAFVTSLPELVTSIAALKIGAADMALGNLFGSNMFNMFGVALTDMFYTEGRFIGAIDNSFMIVGMLGVLMTSFAVIGNVAKFKRIKVIEVDSLIMMALYFCGMYLLYQLG